MKQIEKSSKEVSSKEKTKSEISEAKIGLRTRSKTNLEDGREETQDKAHEEKKKDDEIEDDFYSCKICAQTFQNHDKYKKHKLSCKRTSMKHVCSKCSKSFGQKSLLQQHYDYRHTNKPKKFICEPCG